MNLSIIVELTKDAVQEGISLHLVINIVKWSKRGMWKDSVKIH